VITAVTRPDLERNPIAGVWPATTTPSFVPASRKAVSSEMGSATKRSPGTWRAISNPEGSR